MLVFNKFSAFSICLHFLFLEVTWSVLSLLVNVHFSHSQISEIFTFLGSFWTSFRSDWLLRGRRKIKEVKNWMGEIELKLIVGHIEVELLIFLEYAKNHCIQNVNLVRSSSKLCTAMYTVHRTLLRWRITSNWTLLQIFALFFFLASSYITFGFKNVKKCMDITFLLWIIL